MKQLYAEIFALFFRFYAGRSDLNPTLSAGAFVAAVQMVCVVDLALIFRRFGLIAVDLTQNHGWLFVTAIALLLTNYLVLRGGRAQSLLTLVSASSLQRGRWALAVVAFLTVVVVLFYRRALVFA
jgi:hypothetical protein